MSTNLFIWFRRVVMIAVPLALVCLEWNHPSHFSKNVYAGLSPLKDWWMWLHIYQSFLFGGVGVAAYLLTWNSHNFAAVVSKAAVWLFLVCYLVFDATAGIAVGLMIDTVQKNPQMNLETVQEMIQIAYLHPIVGGSGSFFSLTGSWAWLIALVAAIVAMFFDRGTTACWKLLVPFLLLMIAAYVLYIGHYAPYGPIAFGCFAAASIWFELFRVGPGRRA